MKIGIYKDTFANNRGADIAVKNLAVGLGERGYSVTLFDRAVFAEKVHGDYDVIISTGTNEILDAFAAKDGRVRVVHKINGGYGSAINSGLAAAKGEWIAILESDDVCSANMLSSMVATGERESADMVKADWNLWWHKTGDIRPAGKINRSWRGDFLEKARERLGGYKLLAMPEKLLRKIERKVDRREHRRRRIVSLHCNSNRIELIVLGRTWLYIRF